MCQKDETPHFQTEHITHFGNLIGSNNYRDLPNVIVVHTRNLNDTEYILRYLHYHYGKIPDINTRSRNIGSGVTTRYAFTSSTLENIRIKWIANEMYQAVKRVNRQMIHSTNCFLICNNTDVVNAVAQKLKNCNIRTVDNMPFEFNFTKQEKYIKKQKENSYATRFITLLSELKNGQHKELQHRENVYKKQTIREYLSISSAKDFNNKVLSKTEVIRHCNARDIDLSGQYIKFAS